MTRWSMRRLWLMGIPREDEDDCWVKKLILLGITHYPVYPTSQIEI